MSDKLGDVSNILRRYTNNKGESFSSIAERIDDLYAPPPVVGDLREKIAEQCFITAYPVGIGITGCEWNKIGKPNCFPNIKEDFYKQADSILALIDIDKGKCSHYPSPSECHICNPTKRETNSMDEVEYGK